MNPHFAPSKQPLADLTADELRAWLRYDEHAGVFFRQGRAVGSLSLHGYVTVRLGRARKYLAHRLAWLFVHGEWPDKQIDHVNGDRADNRLGNLRLATRAQNERNRGASRSNTSGFKGVCFDRSRDKWLATIGVDGRARNLGRFNTPEAAYAAYCAAAARFHGEFARVA